MVVQELKAMVGSEERILYEGRSDKKCFIFESIFNPFLFFSIIWLLFDLFLFSTIFYMMGFNKIVFVFAMVHMMPVWVYVIGLFFSFRKYRQTYYIVTDRGVYISSGMFALNFDAKPFTELSRINLHRGVLDQLFHVGDIIITTNQRTDGGRFAVMKIDSISNYAEVYQMIKKLQEEATTMRGEEIR